MLTVMMCSRAFFSRAYFSPASVGKVSRYLLGLDPLVASVVLAGSPDVVDFASNARYSPDEMGVTMPHA